MFGIKQAAHHHKHRWQRHVVGMLLYSETLDET